MNNAYPIIEHKYDVVVVGAGGAGLRATFGLAQLGLKTCIIEKDKLGFKTEILIKHPFIKDKKIPLFLANFVLMDYGSGAIFGCCLLYTSDAADE